MTQEDIRYIGECVGKAVKEIALQLEIPEFAPGSVPVALVANIYGKDATWIKAGIISGWLPIGIATRKGKQITDLKEMDSRLGNISYHISPLKLWRDTGYVWKGERSLTRNV